MGDDPGTTRVSLASRLSRLLPASPFLLRHAHFRNHFRLVPPTPSPAIPSEVLRSFRPEIPVTVPAFVTRRHLGCIIRPMSLHELH